MRKIAVIVLSLSAFVLKAQDLDKLDFGFQISPGSTLANVKDDHPESSEESVTSDGFTSVDENSLKGRSIKFIVNYNIKDNFSISSGLQFGKRRLNIKNEDGSYVGTSVYHVSYLHLPILLKYRSNEIIEKLRIIGSVGPTIDFKLKEKGIGSDYAHYLNLANNRSDIDPSRGANGNNKQMKLFGGLGFSLLFSAAAEYNFTDNWSANLGLSFHPRLSNMLNRKLDYNDANKTSITETNSWKSSLLSLDLGVGYRF